ncbi:MAG: hypothetical protein JAY99_09590 [Candidatus Thiodiazotropha lotti]|nr:hypothetical protein [Candidatus Thiodiazotropha lotti]MCG7999767.1 hypothetical protein [Candidatus Thiodiazotropha lotti]MCW4182044.1 hypothetical protein [Candidatus Thiodiazotropha weberae]MCW4191536.1 hypothetical protein [Candidatus Thiodiazotropha weberae]
MTDDKKQHLSEALNWIVSLLNQHRIPYMICGGLTAIGCGSKLELNDIDLFAPGVLFQKVVELGKKYISKPPQHYCEGWDLEYVQFIYCGVKIEVGNPNGANFFCLSKCTIDLVEIGLPLYEANLLLDLKVTLMNRNALIKYKKTLGRPVDLLHIEVIK